MIQSYFIVINVVALIMYGIDKLAAKLGVRRIPEIILLNISLLGGMLGAMLGMVIFRHKIRKRVFVLGNIACLLLYGFFVYIWERL